jgi:hypothetical protein
MPRLAFIDDRCVVREQFDDRLGVALCLEREVAINDFWDLSGRGWALLRPACRPCESLAHMHAVDYLRGLTAPEGT